MIATILAVGLGGLTVLIGAELLTRWVIRRRARYYVWPPRYRLRMELDRETHPQLDPVVRFEINGEGERGSEPPRNSESAFRILVIGGSAAECYFLDQASTWPALLEAYLSEPSRLRRLGKRVVHVGNLARSLLRSAALRLIAERLLSRHARVDVIVIFTGASEVMTWLSQGADPAAIQERPVLDDIFAFHPERAFRFSWRESGIREALRRMVNRIPHKPEVRTRTGRWIGRARAMRANATELRDVVPDSAALTSSFAENLRQIIRVASTRADHVLVVRQPWFDKPKPSAAEASLFWNGGAGNPQTETITSYYTHEVIMRLLSDIDDTTAAVAREFGLEAVHLRDRVEASAANYYDHLHFTNAGARAVAEAIGEAMLRAIGSGQTVEQDA